jgi:hypothetical protein
MPQQSLPQPQSLVYGADATGGLLPSHRRPDALDHERQVRLVRASLWRRPNTHADLAGGR